MAAPPTRDEALHLLRRATYGPTPASLAEVTARGTSAWLERQLVPDAISDPQGDAIYLYHSYVR